MAVTSKPRVRIYGTTALVTEHAAVSGMSMHKPYVNVQECQTDVLVWKDNGWVSELTARVIQQRPIVELLGVRRRGRSPLVRTT